MQTLVSCFYYFIFRESFMLNAFNRTFWANLSYVIVPLLPVSFTIFWKSTMLYGTICFLKMERYLKKLVSTNDSESKSRKHSLKSSNRNSTFKSYEKLNRVDSLISGSESLINARFNNENDDESSSKLGELNSIESLLAAMPFDETESKNSYNCFQKVFNSLKFHIKVIKLILIGNSDYSAIDDDTLRNSEFIYHSNFLIGLGITTV